MSEFESNIFSFTFCAVAILMTYLYYKILPEKGPWSTRRKLRLIAISPIGVIWGVLVKMIWPGEGTGVFVMFVILLYLVTIILCGVLITITFIGDVIFSQSAEFYENQDKAKLDLNMEDQDNLEEVKQTSKMKGAYYHNTEYTQSLSKRANKVKENLNDGLQPKDLSEDLTLDGQQETHVGKVVKLPVPGEKLIETRINPVTRQIEETINYFAGFGEIHPSVNVFKGKAYLFQEVRCLFSLSRNEVKQFIIGDTVTFNISDDSEDVDSCHAIMKSMKEISGIIVILFLAVNVRHSE